MISDHSFEKNESVIKRSNKWYWEITYNDILKKKTLKYMFSEHQLPNPDDADIAGSRSESAFLHWRWNGQSYYKATIFFVNNLEWKFLLLKSVFNKEYMYFFFISTNIKKLW